MGNVTFIGLSSRKIIAVCPLLNTSVARNFDGTAKAMEGEGTLRIARQLKEKGHTVSSFLHDGDSSSFASIREIFPDCVELNCINHAAQNIRKHVNDRIGTEWGNKCRGFACEVMRDAAEEEDPNQSLFDGLCRMVSQYSGSLTECIHERTFDRKEAMTATEVETLKSILSKDSMNLENYSHGCNQSLCESFNQGEIIV